MVEPVPWVILAVSMVLFTAYYVWIMMRVPPKRSLSFKGRLALYLATSKVGTFNVSRRAGKGDCCVTGLFVTHSWLFCVCMYVSATGCADGHHQCWLLHPVCVGNIHEWGDTHLDVLHRTVLLHRLRVPVLPVALHNTQHVSKRTLYTRPPPPSSTSSS